MFKAFVTSIGEPTTDLCVWSLQRNGFEVHILNNKNSLASKLCDIYNSVDEDFLRVDADIIVNKKMTPGLLEHDKLSNPDIWWWQYTTYDWYKQDANHALSFIRKEALPALRSNCGRFLQNIRPETELSRIKEFYGPRRFETHNILVGLHGYGIKNIKEVIKLKANRGQSHYYDFELAQKLNEL